LCNVYLTIEAGPDYLMAYGPSSLKGPSKNYLNIFFYKSYYQESNILIIVYSSVITVAEWLDGSFESQNRL
jgi:hypothetical protein